MLDALDIALVEKLVSKGRATWAELAHMTGLSSPSIADRVKRLEEKGVIKGYAALLDYEEIGYGVTAFIAVNLEHPKHIEPFLRAVAGIPVVEECHHVAGDADYLLKVRCKTNRDLDNFLNGHLKVIAGVRGTKTTLVLATNKDALLSSIGGGT